MKAVKGWGGFHLWRGVQGGEPKGGQPSMIDCGGSIAGERGREIAGSDEQGLDFSNGKCGREIERKEIAGLCNGGQLEKVTQASSQLPLRPGPAG